MDLLLLDAKQREAAERVRTHTANKLHCPYCSGYLFNQCFMLQKVSPFTPNVPPNIKRVAFPVFICRNCGEVAWED